MEHHGKRILIVLALAAVLTGIWIWIGNAALPGPVEERFQITAFPVGNADALLLQEGDTAILVDTGEEEDGPALAEELGRRGIRHLDLMVVTHFDKDHVGGAACLMKYLDVDKVLMPDYEGDRPEYAAFLESLQGHPDVQPLGEVTEFSLGDMDWTIYPAEAPGEIMDTEKEYDNDLSLVASVTFGTQRFLLTGDIEKTRIGQMLATDVNWRHDWIKMPHHGRYQKALKDLLDAVQPSQAVICCSKEEPTEEKTQELLSQRHIEAWDTSEHTVVTVSDGERIEMRYE